jgi:hypothetical protein
MPIHRGPLIVFVATLLAAGVLWSLRPRTEPGIGTAPAWTAPADDPRFRRVTFRQDELMDVPVLAEAFRIARAKCFLRDCTASDAAAYTELFGESFLLLERTDSYVVVFSRQGNRPPGERSWWAPRITDTASFSFGNERVMDEHFRSVEYQTPALTMVFAKVGDRLTLTDTAAEGDVGEGELSLGDDFVSLSYYPLPGVSASARIVTEESVRRRMAHARRVLLDVQIQAIAAGPDAPQLRRPLLLDWLPADHPCGCDARVHSPDALGRHKVEIGIRPLMEFSDNRLRRLFGHELGHIARCMESDDVCQEAAEAHALKLMGPELYRRARTIAEGDDEKVVSALIAVYNSVNTKYPRK